MVCHLYEILAMISKHSSVLQDKMHRDLRAKVNKTEALFNLFQMSGPQTPVYQNKIQDLLQNGN